MRAVVLPAAAELMWEAGSRGWSGACPARAPRWAESRRGAHKPSRARAPPAKLGRGVRASPMKQCPLPPPCSVGPTGLGTALRGHPIPMARDQPPHSETAGAATGEGVGGLLCSPCAQALHSDHQTRASVTHDAVSPLPACHSPQAGESLGCYPCLLLLLLLQNRQGLLLLLLGREGEWSWSDAPGC